MIDWKLINTVLLDMDGTLLDLNFDNHFWQHFVPQKFADHNGISLAEAKMQLIPLFKRMEGKLEWYCLDYWTETLALDIIGLKNEVSGLIAVLPHVVEFLEKIRQSPQQVFLVTNAHYGSLSLKMEKTCLAPFFDGIISSHDIGYAKEDARFWPILAEKLNFAKANTLFVDDNIAVLQSAKQFGIAHLISVSKPDSQQPKKTPLGFPAIEDFRELMPGL
ncbi:MAG: GMP/IMP nucleotidase [Methylococcaceae bacterium]|jgi:putative hydrolase of the HAD superfamily